MRQFSSVAFFLLTLLSLPGFSQTGTIKGSVKDGTSGEEIVGANVYILGQTIGAAADVDGNYQIDHVKAGTYTLVASFVSYATDTIPNITVYPDQTTQVNIKMHEAVENLQTVTVTSRRMTNTDVSVITEIKKADLVAVGISSQMIGMSQDKDAGQVMRRVPGVTIVNDHFVNVRGLSERYSTVMLNGVLAPSTEVDSKAFAFDLIPSNLIDRMMVYKSGAADLPGEFAGAVIDIYTKDVVEENSMSVGLSTGFRAGSTGHTFRLREDQSSSDKWGFGVSSRELPSAFPSENLRILSQDPTAENQQKLRTATSILPNTWGTRSFKALPDMKFNFNLARTMKLGNKKLDNVTSINYGQSNVRFPNVDQWYYENVGPRYEYHDERFRQVSRIGAISNFTFEFNPSNRIEFRNLYNRLGQDEATFRTGTEFLQGAEVKNEGFNYFSRGIYSGQLSGKHSLSDAITVNWLLGYNNAVASHPDYRRIRSQRGLSTEGDFAIVIPGSASNIDAGRFFSDLNENTYTASGSVEWKLNPTAEEKKQTKITSGFYLESKNRSFRARWMSYKWASFGSVDLSLLYTDFDKIFSPANIDKFVLEEGTNEGPDNYDNYDGINQMGAGYTEIATPLGDAFRLSAGIRVEYNDLALDVYDANKNKLRVADEPLTTPMPFVNLSHNFTDNMLVRVAYSKTVNRPLFRELAPFDYYDFDNNADVIGEPGLKTAKIDNVDLRWELYPTADQTISLGVFYKHFDHPIETTLDQESNLIYRPRNASEATDYGVEAEIRKNLTFAASDFLSKLSLVANVALIKSDIHFPDAPEFEKLEKKRALQGQSPYIANAGIFYNDPDHGWQFSAMYNVFGPRIFAVGQIGQNPTQYELPRNQVDLTVTRQFGDHFQMKAGVQDLLNSEYRLYQDSDYNHKINTSKDDKIASYRTGQLATLELGWRF